MAQKEKSTSFIEDKFVPVAAAIGGQRHLLALRDGIVMIMPLLIVGSFAMVIFQFPIPAWYDWIESIGWGEGGHLDIVVGFTFGISAIIAAFGVAASLAGSYKKPNGEAIDGIPAGILSLAVFYIITQIDEGTPDSAYLLVAMFFALCTAEVYRIFIQKDWIIKLPESVPLAISRQFTALVPGIVVIFAAWIIAIPMTYTEYHTLANWLNEGLFGWLSSVGTSFPITMFAAFLEHLLWTFGLHGAAVVIFPFFEPLWLAVTTPGTASIITWPFYENGIWIGGSGATLPVVVYMLIFAKSKLLKDIGKVSIGPGIFNINEPVTFGLPVVLNPILMIPFIITPLVLVIITYIGTAIGIFPILDKFIPWTTPVFISGFLAASGGIGARLMAVVNQIICFVVAFLIYLPFIRAWDIINVKQEAGTN